MVCGKNTSKVTILRVLVQVSTHGNIDMIMSIDIDKVSLRKRTFKAYYHRYINYLEMTDIFQPEVVIWRDVVIIANMENPADVD